MIRLPEGVRQNISDWYVRGVPFLFVVDYTGERARVWRLADVPDDRVVYQFGGVTNRRICDVGVEWGIREACPWERYHGAFARVQEYQRRGENYLLNLTFPTGVYLSEDLWTLSHAVRAPYVLGMRGEFVVFSPETFVVIEGGRISAFPMKGTVSAERVENLSALYDDPKEQAEHVAVVDLLRNDLGQVCRSVGVRRYRYAEKVERGKGELYQTSSHIEGVLCDVGMGEVFEMLLPAGSISGVPKPRALEIIAEVEGYDRGWYTGVCALFDGRRLVSAVMIRYLEETREGMVYKSGGGVMIYSDARREYQELMEKIYVPAI